MHTSWHGEGGAWYTRLRGRQVFGEPRINKGTGFTPEEREALGLVGLMPYKVFTLEQQVARSYAQYSAQRTALATNVFLTALPDRNEVLYYRLLTDHLREMLPIVYTPTTGVAIERYSHQYRRPRGVYLSVDAPELIEPSLAATDLDPDEVDLIVATDAEAILGIGDWGVGGIAIAEGKLVVYCAAGGIDPNRAIPVVLDVGTNRQELLDDPLYLGNAHPRVDRDTYDRFIDAYVTAATKLFPDAMVGCGLSEADATARIWALARPGLLTDDMDLRSFQRPWARPAGEVADWERDADGRIGLVEVIRRVAPTILVGTSTQPGTFTEAVVRTMAQGCEQPIILPLSNPTRLSEADPADLIRWSDGRALVATGSPFEPVTYDKVSYVVGQANNALVFPGLGLGAVVARASRVTDHMILAAAQAV